MFTLEARPRADSPDFVEAGGAYVTCYQKPGFADDPMRRASEFIREQGWVVVAVEDEPVQVDRDVTMPDRSASGQMSCAVTCARCD